MNTIRWIVPLAGAGMLAAASIVGLERTETRFEPEFEPGIQASFLDESLVAGDESDAPRAVVLPAGTAVAVILESARSTRNAQPGDRFHARIAAPVRVHGRVVIPRGADVEGHVASSDPSGTGLRPGRMQLTYELVRFDGRAYGLNSRSRVYEGASSERSGWPPATTHGPEMEFDAGATLEFELDQSVAMMREADAT